MVTVLIPGSFDPIHNGHVEVIDRACAIFDRVIVGAIGNPQKHSGMFTMDQRKELVQKSLAHLPNVEVEIHGGLVVDFAAEIGADCMVKGLRSVADFETEIQMAQTNEAIGGVPTVFLPATSGHGFVASRYVREIARLGGNVSGMVPGPVAEALQELFST